MATNIKKGKVVVIEIAKQGPPGPPGAASRNIYVSSNDPSNGDGADGDIWFKVQ